MTTDHWCLVSRYGEGKSTFAAQMSPEFLVLDYDGRWEEQIEGATGKSHLISTNDVLESIKEMDRRMPDLKGKVGTVVVDSGTSVIDYIESAGRLADAIARKQGQKFNLNDVHKEKADSMRVLKGAIQRYQCSSLWIFHLEDGLVNGKPFVRSTISKTELERLKSGLNAVLSIQRNGEKRGIKVEWCRYNSGVAAGQVIWDEQGFWQGVPQKLSVFLRRFKGDEGYNGKAYSAEWLKAYLAAKGITFGSVVEMADAMNIKQWPAFWDRRAWGEIIERAGGK